MSDPLKASWYPVDLAAYVTGDVARPEPTLGLRSDGQALLYPGKVHSIAGESEAGKSWIALIWCAAEIRAGRPVLYIDLEDDPHSVVGRLRDLGVTPDLIREYFVYVRPDGPLADADKTLLADRRPFALITIDGVTELMSMYGLDPKNDVDVVEMLRLPRALAASGAAVVLLDHVVKERMSRGRYATGSQHKLSGIDGAAYTLVIKEPFGLGLSGSSTLVVTKDRPGAVRRHGIKTGAGSAVAILNVKSASGGASFALDPYDPDAADNWLPTKIMQEISELLERRRAGLTFNGLKDLVGGRSATVKKATTALISQGNVEVIAGKNRSQIHRSIHPYRAPD